MLLTFTIFLPLIGMIAVLTSKSDGQARSLGMTFTFITAVFCAVVAMSSFGVGDGDYTEVTDVSWISVGKTLDIRYHIGVDGLSGMLIFLTGLLAICAGIASLGIKENVKGYWAMFLLLHVGVLGTFAALDLFLFYVFWEIMLLPMYFLIGIWGGPRQSIYAAIKFFIYTLAGSILPADRACWSLYFYTGQNDPADSRRPARLRRWCRARATAYVIADREQVRALFGGDSAPYFALRTVDRSPA